MPQILWTRYFLESQGYKDHVSVMYQDNQSAMILEKNGIGSSWKRTMRYQHLVLLDKR